MGNLVWGVAASAGQGDLAGPETGDSEPSGTAGKGGTLKCNATHADASAGLGTLGLIGFAAFVTTRRRRRQRR